jgi:hypothetical protein
MSNRTHCDDVTAADLHRCVRALAALVDSQRRFQTASVLDEYADMSSTTRNLLVSYYSQLMEQQYPFFDATAQAVTLKRLTAGPTKVLHRVAMDSATEREHVVVSYTHLHCRPTTTLCAVLDAMGAELTHVLAQTHG